MCLCAYACADMCFYTLLLRLTCLAQPLAGVARGPCHRREGKHVGKPLQLGKEKRSEGLVRNGAICRAGRVSKAPSH